MSFADLAKSVGIDKYSLQARLRPALFTVLPIFVLIAIWLPKVWNLLGTLVALVSTCGLTFVMSEVARYRGRVIERKMIVANGGKFTTIFLRHRDSTLSSASKSSYHALLAAKTKRPLPTAQAEAADPEWADDQYRGAVDWLLEATRDERRFPLVKLENIAYGFRRNLVGLRSAALTIALACFVIDVSLTKVSWGADSNRFWTGVVVAVGLACVELVWLLVVRIPFVEDAGRTYAIRLLAQCEVLKKPAGNRGQTK